jgi:hypothetical protein
MEVKSSVLSSWLVCIDSFSEIKHCFFVVLIEVLENESVMDKSESIVSPSHENFVESELSYG